MKVLSLQEAREWCRDHHVSLSDRGFPEISDSDFWFEIPSDAQRRVHLVARMMKEFGEEPRFLVWFADWSVWPSGQRMHIFDRFRMSYGETRPLIESPGHVFEGPEIEDATSFVTIAALMLWDCYVVGPGRGRMLCLSHDEWGSIKGVDLPDRAKWLTILPNATRDRI